MHRRFFLFLAFITEWALLTLEMAAFKMFAPYFGTSLYIWGNIVGIVMIGSSIGYYVGGKISDIHPEAKLLMRIVMITGAFIIFVPFLSSLIIIFLSNIQHSLFISFVYGVILFGLPAILIEIVPPFVVRLENQNLETVGTSVGLVYSFSTVGGITGVISSSFITIPLWGVKETIFISGAILLSLGIFGFLKFREK